MNQTGKNFDWFGFHKLLRRVIFRGTLANLEPLRIGTGKAEAAFEPVDAVVVKARDASGRIYPYIPGSSLKGAFRSYVVKLLRSQDIENVCDGVPKACCLGGEEFKDLEKKGVQHSYIVDAIASGEISICLACFIFGSPGISSHTKFYDAYPQEGTWRLGYRTMVAIDRRTGASHPGALYSVEYIEPGARFNFVIEFLNLPNYAIGVVAEALLDLDMGLLKIGGMKSRGFGRLKIEKLDIDVHDYRGEVKGIVYGLDPIDYDVVIDTNNWRNTLINFVNVWKNASTCLREISKKRWVWRTCQK
ncbi:MAG: CRISPR-associated RAMP protein Csx7 [Ignisphaera sp.]